MQSDPTPPGAPDPAKGLPPVLPPSGRHIAQLFLVPGIIVALFVAGAIGWNKLTHSWYSPDAFLRNLDNTNPKVRWRAADDLAQNLLRDDRLASDPKFALDLTERVRQALDASGPAEKDLAEHSRKLSESEIARERADREAERVYIEYLTACLGNFMAPVSVPLLDRMATNPEGGGDPATLARRRRRAVAALANLGANLKRFDRLPPEQQQGVLAQLQQEAGPSERGRWADAALQILQGRLAGSPETAGVDETLARTAADRDPFVREMAAVAMNYWQGDARQNKRMEDALVELAQHDDGHGADDPDLAPLFHDEEGHGVDDDPRKWAAVIRSQANVALVRRGSTRVREDVIRDLLDEARQLETFRRKLPEGGEAADEALAFATVTNTLKALTDRRRQHPGHDFPALVPAIEKLTESANAPVRAEAQRTLITLRQE